MNQKTYLVKNPNLKLNPYTGLVREHWVDFGLWLLQGAFSHVKKFDDPLLFPKQPGVSYPRDKNPQGIIDSAFEGLTRTFFVAAPLINESIDIEVNNYNLRDYYSQQIY